MFGNNTRRLETRRGGKEMCILRKRKWSAQRTYRPKVFGDSTGVQELRCDTEDT